MQKNLASLICTLALLAFLMPATIADRQSERYSEYHTKRDPERYRKHHNKRDSERHGEDHAKRDSECHREPRAG